MNFGGIIIGCKEKIFTPKKKPCIISATVHRKEIFPFLLEKSMKNTRTHSMSKRIVIALGGNAQREREAGA